MRISLLGWTRLSVCLSVRLKKSHNKCVRGKREFVACLHLRWLPREGRGGMLHPDSNCWNIFRCAISSPTFFSCVFFFTEPCAWHEPWFLSLVSLCLSSLFYLCVSVCIDETLPTNLPWNGCMSGWIMILLMCHFTTLQECRIHSPKPKFYKS